MKKTTIFLFIFVFCFCIGACDLNSNKDQDSEDLSSALRFDHSMELDYATQFSVDYYIEDASENEYKLITIEEEGKYLVVPDDGTIPDDLSEEIVVIRSPHQIYLVASQVMDMFASIDAMDTLQFSALKADDWYIEAAKEAMENGSLIYAGKYSAPDYEQILEKGCDLAIENTMIYHSPEVKEKLESFDIPVLVDHSSYETEPLGRTEWVKLYGALTGQEDRAKQAFEEQVDAYESVAEEESEDNPSVAFFYISANGDVKVRKSSDYLVKMISKAGGNYIFSELGEDEENASSTVSMQMEEFYQSAKNADYLIYNSTIEGEVENLDDLIAKNELLANLKAVKNGHAYCTTQNMYQSTMEIGTITSDIHKILTGETDLTYFYELK